MTPTMIISRCVIAAIIALAMSASGLLDGPDDTEAEHDTHAAHSQALRELQASAPATSRRERAAHQLCTEVRGPGAQVRWTPGGDLVCSAPHRINILNHFDKEARL